MPRATIDDVAELAGVSIKTVSRVVNKEPNVREETREKVEKAITQLHYRPNVSARNLASQRSRLIALVYDDPGTFRSRARVSYGEPITVAESKALQRAGQQGEDGPGRGRGDYPWVVGP